MKGFQLNLKYFLQQISLNIQKQLLHHFEPLNKKRSLPSFTYTGGPRYPMGTFY